MPSHSSRPARFEPLERRVLLSLAPLGDVFRAADTVDPIVTSDVGMDGDGDYAFVWHSRPLGFPVTNFIDSRVFGRIGLSVGDVQPVEDTPEYLDVSPSMGMDRNGEFAVAWVYDTEIRVRLFRSDGIGKGPSSVVAVAPDSAPSLAMNPMGQFAVAWAIGNKIFARAYNADGSPQTGTVELNSSSGDVQRTAPSVALDHAGGFVVAWRHDQNGSTSIRTRRVSAQGTLSAAESTVQSAVALSEGPLAGSDAAGNFVVVWRGADGIRARRGFASGATRGPAFPVEPATSAASGIDLAVEGDGDFIVSWMASALHCKQFSAIGQPAGEKVAIPGAVGGVTHLAVDGGGTMAVVDWRSGYTQDSVQHYTIEGRRISVTQPPDPGPDPYPDPIPIPGPPGNTAPITSGIAEVVVDQDAPNTAVPLFDSFADAQDGDGALYYGLIGNTNVGLFSAVMIDNVTGLLTLDYAPGASGAATLTVRATDTGGASVQAAFNVTVRPVAPTPGPGPTPDPTPASTPTPNPNPVGSPPVALGNGALAGRLLTKARRRKPAGLPGVVVFIDTNLNGGWDADELSATTDAAGSYAFIGLAPGRYRVRAATPAGYELLGARRDGGLRNAVVKVKQRKPAKVKPLVLKAPPA